MLYAGALLHKCWTGSIQTCAEDVQMCITDSKSPNVTFRIDMHSLAIGALRRGWQPHSSRSAWLNVVKSVMRSPWKVCRAGSGKEGGQHQQNRHLAQYLSQALARHV